MSNRAAHLKLFKKQIQHQFMRRMPRSNFGLCPCTKGDHARSRAYASLAIPKGQPENFSIPTLKAEKPHLLAENISESVKTILPTYLRKLVPRSTRNIPQEPGASATAFAASTDNSDDTRLRLRLLRTDQLRGIQGIQGTQGVFGLYTNYWGPLGTA